MAKHTNLRITLPFFGSKTKQTDKTVDEFGKFTEKRSLGFHERRANHHDGRVIVLEKRIVKHQAKAEQHRNAVATILEEIEKREEAVLDAITKPATKPEGYDERKAADREAEKIAATVSTPVGEAKVEKTTSNGAQDDSAVAIA